MTTLHPARRLALLAVAAAAGLTALPGASAAPAATAAAAPEVYPVPASRVLTLDGHGYGHGRGLSQWGSQGAATLGKSATEILNAYYPGTSGGSATGAVKIVLTHAGLEGRLPTGGDDGRYECDLDSSSASARCVLEVVPASGLTARDGSGAAVSLPSTVGGAAVRGWRVPPGKTGLDLQAVTSSGAVAYRSSLASPVTFSGTDPSVRYQDGSVSTYRGTVSAVRTTGRRVARVNSVDLEQYLYSVVPKESPASWEPAALQAQSVAARSYSVSNRDARASQVWHLCDSTYCQVYGGRTAEDPRTNAAVDATRAAVRTYGGKVVRAEFSASNGGWSTYGGVPWLPARADAWDGVVPNSSHTWRTDVPARTLELRYGLSRLEELVVLSRDGNGQWGGRALDVELRGLGTSGAPITVRTTGDSIRSAAGLRSSWFRPQPSPAPDLSRGASSSTPGTVELLSRSSSGSAAAQTWSATSGLSAARSLGGAVRGAPAVAARAGRQPEAFVRGTNDRLYTSARSTSGSWSTWQSLGGVLSGRPAVAAAGDELHVFVAGRDGAVWHRSSRAPGAWSAWASLGGRLAPGSGPAAVSPGPGRLDLVVRGADGRAWSRSLARGTWGGWTGLGGRLAGDPTVASAAGELTVVVRGTDGAGWTRSATSGWTPLGGRLLSDPAAAAAPGSGRVDVFVTGTDGRLYRTTRTTAWSGWTRVS